jgi:hypothetical protein
MSISVDQLVQIRNDEGVAFYRTLAIHDDSMQLRRLSDDWLVSVKEPNYHLIHTGCTKVLGGGYDDCRICGIGGEFSILAKDLIHTSKASSFDGYYASVKWERMVSMPDLATSAGTEDEARQGCIAKLLKCCFNGRLGANDLRQIIIARRTLSIRDAVLLAQVPEDYIISSIGDTAAKMKSLNYKDLDFVFSAQDHYSSLQAYVDVQRLTVVGERNTLPPIPGDDTEELHSIYQSLVNESRLKSSVSTLTPTAS